MDKNKRVGLVAVSNHNYGSQLQTFAMHKALLMLGVDNEIIKYKQNPIKQIKRAMNPAFLMMKGKSSLRNLSCRLLYPDIAVGLRARAKAFEDFKAANCTYSPYISERSVLEEYVKGYKAVVLGSDQVWHPANLEMDYFTLNFVPDSIPKIAYAPSFGVSAIPSKQEQKTKEYLQRIDAISVREKSGAVIVKKMTGNSCSIVCDPTALLSKDDWDAVKGERQITDEKYIFCYFLGNNPEHRSFAKKIKAATGYKIIALQHLDELVKEDIKFGDIKPFDISPADFVNLVANAEIVLTDSFHGTMFSIYYHKNFYTFSRFADGSKGSTNSRIDSILETVGLEERHISTAYNHQLCLKNNVNWEDVDSKLKAFREDSIHYLKEALERHGIISSRKINTVADKDKSSCTGCTACQHICPKHCIELKEDDEGFKYPAINFKDCIQCGACVRVCPVNSDSGKSKSDDIIRCYAARNVAKDIRMTSSSGGMFNALASWFIDKGGLVAGACFDDKMVLRHRIVDSIEDLKPLQASKYVQSDLGNIFIGVRQALEQGKYVLFCGTPCQASGLKHFLKKDYETLLVADVLCYGVPSPGVFKDYIQYIEQKHKVKIKDFYFRDKTYGYASPNVKAVFEDGSYEEMTSDIKSYTKTFFSGVTTRPSCYSCAFKTLEKEIDLTLGDFWNIADIDTEMDDDTGATLVFAHTNKAVDILKKLSGIKLVEIPDAVAKDYAGPMLTKCARKNANREAFFEDYSKLGYIGSVNKYVPDSLKNKIANFVKPLLLKTGFTKLGILKVVKKEKIKNESRH